VTQTPRAKAPAERRRPGDNPASHASAVAIAAETMAKSTSTLDAPCRVIDLSTGLPSLTTLFADLRPVVEDPAGAFALYVHLPANALVEEHFGWEALEAYLAVVNNFLLRLAKDTQRERSRCVIARAFADDYVLVMPYAEGDEEIGSRIADEMNRHVQVVDEELASMHEVYLGSSRIKLLPRIHPERMLYRGIQRAQAEATDVGRHRLAAQTRLLDRCIQHPDTFSMLYQPLVRMEDHSIFAYEALVRCSAEGLRNPHVLFNVAEQSDRIWPLSRLLRRKAVEHIKELPGDALLFINIHPHDFDDPQIMGPEPYIKAHAERIVFEVTERAAIGDFVAFRSRVDALRATGLRIAIDDLGSGYAALSSAAELNPDFIKFDMTLVRDIDKSPIRQNLIRNMVAFAVEAKVEVVAEGIETPEELAVLRELGCHFAQGFYLARPAPPFVTAITPRSGEWMRPPPRRAVEVPPAL
jgi:EAL domain-containing protein (putative c-di-GMP-specific phosphodiesterase class I)